MVKKRLVDGVEKKKKINSPVKFYYSRGKLESEKCKKGGIVRFLIRPMGLTTCFQIYFGKHNKRSGNNL